MSRSEHWQLHSNLECEWKHVHLSAPVTAAAAADDDDAAAAAIDHRFLILWKGVAVAVAAGTDGDHFLAAAAAAIGCYLIL